MTCISESVCNRLFPWMIMKVLQTHAELQECLWFMIIYGSFLCRASMRNLLLRKRRENLKRWRKRYRNLREDENKEEGEGKGNCLWKEFGGGVNPWVRVGGVRNWKQEGKKVKERRRQSEPAGLSVESWYPCDQWICLSVPPQAGTRLLETNLHSSRREKIQSAAFSFFFCIFLSSGIYFTDLLWRLKLI